MCFWLTDVLSCGTVGDSQVAFEHRSLAFDFGQLPTPFRESRLEEQREALATAQGSLIMTSLRLGLEVEESGQVDLRRQTMVRSNTSRLLPPNEFPFASFLYDVCPVVFFHKEEEENNSTTGFPVAFACVHCQYHHSVYAGAKVAICELPFGLISSDTQGGAGGALVICQTSLFATLGSCSLLTQVSIGQAHVCCVAAYPKSLWSMEASLQSLS